VYGYTLATSTKRYVADVPVPALRFERIGPGGAERVHAVLATCGRDMVWRYGLSHWDPPYPLEALRDDADKRLVMAAHLGDDLVATFTLGTDEPFPTYSKNFPAGLSQPVYLSRLAVLPARQGKGIATSCLVFIEGIGYGLGADGVRLDVVVAVPGLRDLYLHRGYREVDHVEFAGVQCSCLEKRLPAS
jgi:GNAT superfamily N-acetyltransferase